MIHVSIRKCPSCAGDLLAFSGVAWMSCQECPTAWDLFSEPVGRLVTFRPAGEKTTADHRLPFYVFSENGNLIWIPAYRETGSRSDGDAAFLLTSKHPGLKLAEAPLGASLARDLSEASALLEIRRAGGAGATSGVPPVLVSLACAIKGPTLVEPITGATLVLENVLPRYQMP
jgi:hypothetical protein